MVNDSNGLIMSIKCLMCVILNLQLFVCLYCLPVCAYAIKICAWNDDDEMVLYSCVQIYIECLWQLSRTHWFSYAQMSLQQNNDYTEYDSLTHSIVLRIYMFTILRTSTVNVTHCWLRGMRNSLRDWDWGENKEHEIWFRNERTMKGWWYRDLNTLSKCVVGALRDSL